MARLITMPAIGGTRLPLVLLLVVLGSVAGASIWLTLATGGPGSGDDDATAPHARVRLGPALAPGKRAAQSEPASKPAAPTKQAPKKTAPTKPAPKKPAAKSDVAALPPGAPAKPRSTAGRPRISVQPVPAPVSARALPTGLTLPRIATGPPLSIAPDPALVRRGPNGLLPIIGADGRKPWRVYARPFDGADKRPRIAIVVTGLGHSSAGAKSAIQGLPGPVTLAFSPYSRHLGEWIRLARAAGHEILIQVPMEPIDFPADDPGPQTLLTSKSQAENQRRLLWALGRATGYVGVVNHKGSRFTADTGRMRPILAALGERGLLFVDSRTSPRSATAGIAAAIGLPWTIATRRIDPRFARDPIDTRLRELEGIARKNGRAVGIGSVSPVTFERIAAWVNGARRRGFVLAPVSAVVDAGGAG